MTWTNRNNQECQLVLPAGLSSFVNVILGILGLPPQLFYLSSLVPLLLKSSSQIYIDHRSILWLKYKGSFICGKQWGGSESSFCVLKTCCVIFSFSLCHIFIFAVSYFMAAICWTIAANQDLLPAILFLHHLFDNCQFSAPSHVFLFVSLMPVQCSYMPLQWINAMISLTWTSVSCLPFFLFSHDDKETKGQVDTFLCLHLLQTSEGSTSDTLCWTIACFILAHHQVSNKWQTGNWYMATMYQSLFVTF